MMCPAPPLATIGVSTFLRDRHAAVASEGRLVARRHSVPLRLSADPERFVRHCKWLLAHGCSGLAVFGTNSEANSLAAEERLALLEGPWWGRSAR